MTLKQLEAFYWAATAASFLVAAQRLHISQSTLSKRIGELESQLRTTLFNRSGHRAVLTEAGEQMLPMARRILELSEDMRDQLGSDGGVRGHCRFGVGELAALTWLPGLVSHAAAKYPDLRLEPCVDLGAALEQRLESGELDFAVVAGHSTRAAIASETIAQVRFCWAASPALVGRQRRVDAALLERHALITQPGAAGPTRMLEHWLELNGLQAPRRLVCNNLSAIASLIASGLGVGLYPRGWLRRLSARRAVVELRGEQPLPELQYTFQRRRDDHRALLARLRELVVETVDFEKAAPWWEA